ncbi:MAG: hypothetical protein A2Z19_00365 [Deltaproteobacteria bacterium RBG_16_54_18]|nr:MAG: hypothetical protein A2Z19_00365 [Deltaproteobacteria bacterium RBG_16_54_18]
MRKILRGVGIFFLIIAVPLGIMTIASWPPGGLFFALPFLFLIPAIIFGMAGGLLLLLTRKPRDLPPAQERGTRT